MSNCYRSPHYRLDLTPNPTYDETAIEVRRDTIRWMETRDINREVRWIGLDAQTRCAHYNSPLDIVAIRMKCCGVYFACKDCHNALAGHPIEVWAEEQWHRRERSI